MVAQEGDRRCLQVVVAGLMSISLGIIERVAAGQDIPVNQPVRHFVVFQSWWNSNQIREAQNGRHQQDENDCPRRFHCCVKPTKSRSPPVDRDTRSPVTGSYRPSCNW